jgi:hypothetical protein
MELGLCLNSGFSGANDLDVDAHCQRKRFIVRADEKLTAFMELESEISGRFRQDAGGRRLIAPSWYKR